ncbi:MAG: tetratricopeptide repeat protein [Armatimonadota bacterium]
MSESNNKLLQEIERLEEQAKFNSNNLVNILKLANAYKEIGMIAHSYTAYLKVIEIEPSNIDAYLGITDLYYNQQDYNGAKYYLEEVLKASNDNIEVLVKLFRVYLYLKDFKKAKKILDKVLLVECKKYQSLAVSGVYYFETKNYKKAIENFKSALEYNPNDSDTYCWLGAAYYENKEYRLAIEAFENALKYSQNPALYWNIFKCYWDLNDRQSAINMYKKVRNLSVKFADDMYRCLSDKSFEVF